MITRRLLINNLMRQLNYRLYSDSKLKDLLEHKELTPKNLNEVITGEKPRDPDKTISSYMENLVYLDIQPNYRNRVARIHQRTKNVMQQGTDNTKIWILEFDTKERWENPTMGWISSGDSLSNIELEFPSQCSAICYAEKQGWKWFTEKPPRERKVKKNYAEIFAWNKRTRRSTK